MRLALAFGLSLPVLVFAADERLEYQVKAAFLLNFTKFIDWPQTAFETPDSPFAICVLGEDPFGSALDQIVAGEAVKGRRLIVQRIKQAPQPKACQILFVARPEGDTRRIVAELGIGVLTIGDRESFIYEGGMISFQIENRRVRFGINRTNAENAGLRLSSKLLSVARPVEP
jgi:hypothetical protein